MKKVSDRRYLESQTSPQVKVKAHLQVPPAQQHEQDEGLIENQGLNELHAHGEIPAQAKHLQTGLSMTYSE